MDVLGGLSQGFAVALTPAHLGFALLGAGIGTAVGVLPGLGTATTIAMLLPATYALDPTAAIILMSGIFCGAMYGGSTTAILLNVPGESASIATCFDGHQLARQGRAGEALGMSALASFIAASLSVLALSGVALARPDRSGVRPGRSLERERPFQRKGGRPSTLPSDDEHEPKSPSPEPRPRP